MATTTVGIPVREGITLTEIRHSDREAFVEYLNDREIYRCTCRIPFPYAAADADKFLGIIDDMTVKYGHPVNFAIRNSAGALLGGCGFEGLAYGHKAEIGYWVARPFWGQGIATAAVRAACEYAFAEWKLVRIHAYVFDFNLGSARVLEKNGFQFEGLLSKHLLKGTEFIDCKLYALVR
jgi:[ribosomal protein S5]-alanine N-acetyltransferase